MTSPLRVTRPVAAAAGKPLGWGYLLGELVTVISVPSLDAALETATVAIQAAGADADDHVRIDLRADHVRVRLISSANPPLTSTDLELAERITTALRDRGQTPATTSANRAIQSMEIAIDALDIRAIRPFWKTVLGYISDKTDDDNGLVDPAGIGPSFWFQQMEAPRAQRNRIHFDLTVTEDEALARIDAALAAGGHLVSDARARAFWILADAEGNEVCICTWQDRD